MASPSILVYVLSTGAPILPEVDLTTIGIGSDSNSGTMLEKRAHALSRIECVLPTPSDKLLSLRVLSASNYERTVVFPIQLFCFSRSDVCAQECGNYASTLLHKIPNDSVYIAVPYARVYQLFRIRTSTTFIAEKLGFLTSSDFL